MSIAVGIALTTDPERSRGKLEELCRCLSETLGEEVTAHGMWHYHHLLEALATGDLDLVWLPPVLALRATGRGHCIPIALPVRHGVSTYSTALFTRPDSSIREVDDLKGVSAAWVDRQSAAGYLIVRALLRSRGVSLEQAFDREVFLGTHDAVAGAVLDGEVDVGATFVYLDPDTSTGTPKAAGWGDREVHIICHAESIPSDVIAVSHTMEEGLRKRIQEAFVSGTEGDLARAARNLVVADSFIAPNGDHLESLVTILADLEDMRGTAYTKFPPPPRA
jgi:phosphonate transport system substrate-binding protein